MEYVWLLKEEFINQGETSSNIFLTEEDGVEAYDLLKAFYKRQGYNIEEEDDDYFAIPWRVFVSLYQARFWKDVKEFQQTLQ